MDRVLDAQADAFARLLALSPNDPDEAFRKAAELANGLFPHQIEGVAFLLGRTRAILADDMGLGKTRQAIVALRHIAPEGPYLVVSPASVKRNWAREIAIADPPATTHVVEKGSALEGRPDWVIVNYDILPKHVDALEKPAWAGIVFDEAHYLKNHTSMRSRLARRLADRAKSQGRRGPAVYLLTGTPMTNRPRDLFVLLQLVGHPLGRSFLSFAKRYCAAERNEYGWQTRGASNVDELTVQLHGVMLRKSKDDVLALPPKLRTWLTVEVPKGTGVRDMRRAVELMISHERVAPGSSINELRLRGRLLQAVTKARQALAAAKVPSTIDFVSGATEQGEKVIVFSCFEEPMQRLSRILAVPADGPASPGGGAVRRPPPRTCRSPASPASRTPTSTSSARTALLDAVRRCWASLWTDRAVAYRAAQRHRPRARCGWRWWCSGWWTPRWPACCSPPTR